MRATRLALAASLLPISTAGQTQLADGGFEAQGATVSDYCYLGGASPACPAGAWTGNVAGIQDETNSAWPGVATPDGSKYGFVQSTGTLSQSFTADASGTFVLSWLAAGRPDVFSPDFGGDQSYMITLNGLNLGTFDTTSNQPFTPEATSTWFDLVSGQSYTLTFTGLIGADETAFIDAVRLQSVPEPGTWAMMLLGFGAIGFAIRQTRNPVRSTAAA